MHRFRLRTAAATAVLVSLVGCEQERPTFDPSTRYQPETLARDVAAQFRALRLTPEARSKEVAPAPSVSAKAARVRESEAATKKAQVPTLEDILQDAAAKADRIGGMSRGDALRKTAEVVEKDSTLDPSDRQALAEGLRKIAR